MQLQKAVLQNKISLLQNNNVKPFEKEIEELKGQQSLEIPLFEVKLNNLEKFKKYIQNFCFAETTDENLET
jgi:hypothetical protein